MQLVKRRVLRGSRLEWTTRRYPRDSPSHLKRKSVACLSQPSAGRKTEGRFTRAEITTRSSRKAIDRRCTYGQCERTIAHGISVSPRQYQAPLPTASDSRSSKVRSHYKLSLFTISSHFHLHFFPASIHQPHPRDCPSHPTHVGSSLPSSLSLSIASSLFFTPDLKATFSTNPSQYILLLPYPLCLHGLWTANLFLFQFSFRCPFRFDVVW